MLKRFIVFDGNSLLNRAYYGIRPLTNRDGLFTHATYGFFNIIYKHLTASDIPFDFAAVAFDLPEPTFRNKAFDGYKATRKGMPEELAMQLPYAKDMLPLLGIKVLEYTGYEADDILGTIASIAEKNNVECTVVTGDRDSFQLVSDTTTVLLASTNETKVYDMPAIHNQYKLKPLQLIDVKALMGDSSDNIPGVAGVGEKTAVKLIQDYGSLEKLYENIDQIKSSLADKLTSGKEMAFICRMLAEINKQVPISENVDDYKIQPIKKKELLALFTKLEFSKIIEKLNLNIADSEQENINENKITVEAVDESTFLRLTKYGSIAISINTTEKIITASVGEKLIFCDFSEKLSLLFTEDTRNICVWSHKDTANYLKNNFNIDFKSCKDDISLMGYILNPIENGYDLPRLALRYGMNTSQPDALMLALLREELKKQLNESSQTDLYLFELELSEVLLGMEQTGFMVDKEGLDKYSQFLSEQLKISEKDIYEFAGEEFNINSPKQLAVILFEKLGLPTAKKNKSGYSTNADVLEGLRPFNPIIDMILSYRQISKLKSTYTDGLAKVISPLDGRIHTTFRQTLTLTGRLSSVEPNLQNIPVRQEIGRELRKFFVAGDGNVLIDADYSQIELRVLAHISNDEALIQAFKDGEDIHTITASQVFGVPPEAVTSQMRKSAKAVNFGIVYGISDYSLSVDIGVSRKEAGDYIRGYFAKYPKVKEYMDNIVAQAKQDGYVTTLMGRRRYIPELSSPKKPLMHFGERIAMNTPIQGSAADIIKKAMLDVYHAFAEGGYESKLILQVHDELLIEAPEAEADNVYRLLIKKMENAFKLSVPLEVDAHIGKTWYDAKG
ncbi:MAG: DNA polymerase I [Clostridiales bacterium GWF2_38_85]|nr:MAG: DNA polymerase I [Clostridiales bacterium GWF2_38_85]